LLKKIHPSQAICQSFYLEDITTDHISKSQLQEPTGNILKARVLPSDATDRKLTL
jgi:hypothetical protein